MNQNFHMHKNNAPVDFLNKQQSVLPTSNVGDVCILVQQAF